MTNREKLIKTNIYDILFRLNQNIYRLNSNNFTTKNRYNGCIIGYLTNSELVHRKLTCEEKCVSCILQWLDEEAIEQEEWRDNNG